MNDTDTTTTAKAATSRTSSSSAIPSSTSVTSSSRVGELVILDESYFPQCARVMAHAFSNSPSYNYIFPGTTQEYRVEALEWLLLHNLKLTVPKCPSCLRGILNEKGDVVACFLWTPAQHQKLELWPMIQVGLWRVPFKFGVSTLWRLLKLSRSAQLQLSIPLS